jgi:hypothetical protein
LGVLFCSQQYEAGKKEKEKAKMKKKKEDESLNNDDTLTNH